MKHIYPLCLCLLLSVVSIAQTKSSITFGASVLTSSTSKFQDNEHQHYNLHSRVGFFLFDNFSFGLRMENSLYQNDEVPFSLSGYTRLHMGDPERKSIKFYIETGIGAAHNATDEPDLFTGKISDLRFRTTAYISPGINVFFSKTAALELAVEYNYVAGTNKLNRLGASAGITFLLNKKQFTDIFKHEFNSLY